MIKTQCVVVRGNLNALRYSNEILTPVCISHLQNNGRMKLMGARLNIERQEILTSLHRNDEYDIIGKRHNIVKEKRQKDKISKKTHKIHDKKNNLPLFMCDS